MKKNLFAVIALAVATMPLTFAQAPKTAAPASTVTAKPAAKSTKKNSTKSHSKKSTAKAVAGTSSVASKPATTSVATPVKK